jgi:hypothetical protein
VAAQFVGGREYCIRQVTPIIRVLRNKFFGAALAAVCDYLTSKPPGTIISIAARRLLI